jgi:hypothetical protein
MKMDLSLMSSLRVDDDTGLARNKCQALSRCKDVIPKALLAERPSRRRWKRVTHLDLRYVSRDEVDSQGVAYVASRLLVKSNGSEPAGKVTNSRVNR